MNTRIDKRHHKKRKWPWWVGGILLGMLLLIGGYAVYLWNQVNDTIDTMHTPLARDDDPKRQKEMDDRFKETQAVNVLLLGVDERENDKGRSDTMILMSLNPRTECTIMLSIPRDTYVNIPQRGMDKINHAYAFGGVSRSVKTVEDTFDIPVHFYAKVNMEGFKQGIDALGGVTVHNDLSFSQNDEQFNKGDIHLNGEQALKYIRMRKKDPRGDLGRNERQRKVIKAAADEAASFSSITKVTELLNIVGSNVQTNLNKDHLQTLFLDYRNTRKDMKTMEINGSGKYIDSIWYYIVPDKEINRINSDITQHMEAG